MPDPVVPQDIARASFPTVRRGYEPQAVRGFLHEVSALVDRLTRTDQELREQLQRAEARSGLAGEPDEAVLLEVLGAETTRVLTSAHEAAADIRSKAEAAAERIIAEATAEAEMRRATTTRELAAQVARMTAEAEQLRDAAHNELELRRAEAHAAAERIHEESRDATRALREEGQAALARAQEEAAAVEEAAREQGKHMVAEAQAVRERVLRDLSVRRKRARQQVEKLNAGRERLLRAYEMVRSTLDDATNELHVSITDARMAATAAARRVEEEAEATIEELDAEVAAAGLAGLPIVDTDDDPGTDDHLDLSAGLDLDDVDDGGSGPLSGDVPAIGWREDETPTTADPAPVERPEGPASANLEDRRARKGRRKRGFEGLPPSELTVVEPPQPGEGVRLLTEDSPHEPAELADEVGEPAGEVDELAEAVHAAKSVEVVESTEAGIDEVAPGSEPVGTTVSDGEPADPTAAADVFARLREQTEPGAEAHEAPGEGLSVSEAEPAVVDASALGDDGAPSADEAAFAARAEVVAPVERDLLKRLKRALADEQNEVLDLLRRAKPKGLDDVLPEVAEHAQRWAEAASPALLDAATAGASAVGGKAGSIAEVISELTHTLLEPLRERIDRSFVAADGDVEDVADRVRALYREWKGQRLTEASQHYAAAGYARGMFDGIPSGATVRWVVDASAEACPDCDDNALAGAIAKGDDFPTGSPWAPAHPGCHCLVLPDPH